MRGEETSPEGERSTRPGSPPRARGRVKRIPFPTVKVGITPACAGKSPRGGCSPRCRRDHPRVRGEEPRTPHKAGPAGGSPPRARGREVGRLLVSGAYGITPACAGKSVQVQIRDGLTRDHPRVRGEESYFLSCSGILWGSPPRARGRGQGSHADALPVRITPACAGKSPWVGWCGGVAGDHPRVRGEELQKSFLSGRPNGSPPRARGRVRETRYRQRT